MFYNSQKGYGLKDLFRNITRPFKPVLKPVLKEAKAIGAELAGNLIGDLVSGKSSKASVKARGNQAKNMAVQRAMQVFQGGSGHSKSPAKRKRDWSKSQPPKRKRTQTGGIYPPIHYPAGNYPFRHPLANYPPGSIMKGNGFFSNIYKKFDKERIADCKDWLKRKQKGGRRTGKKRKTRKQTGGRRAGKKRKPPKQTGGHRAGKKRKTRKQTGGRRKRKRDAATIFDGVYDVFS